MRVSLKDIEGVFTAKWFDPRTSDWVKPTTVTGGDDRALSTPKDGDWVLLVTR